MSTNHKDKKLFTLIELLAVIALGILLTSLAVPGFRSLTRASLVDECAETIKSALEQARVRAVNERIYVAVIFPNGTVSDDLKQYRLGGFRLARVEKTVSGEYTFYRWIDAVWRRRPRETLLSQLKSSSFVADGGDITGCTKNLTDELAGAAECLNAVSGIKADDGSTPLNTGDCSALIFTPQGSVVGNGKCFLLVSEALTGNSGDLIVYPTAVTHGPGRSAHNIVLKLNKLTGIVEYDK